jgi:hypothetical protein
MGPELGGEDFSVHASEIDSSNKSKPGRRSGIDAETLLRDVIELQFVLEQNWGEVGWLLKQSKTEADVRTAFTKIVNPRCNLLEPFTRDHTLSTETNLRELRKKTEELGDRHRQLYLDCQHARCACEQASSALADESDSLKRAQIQALHATFARKYEEVALLESRSRADWPALRSELEECEAHFVQSEILTHIRSDRRRFTPLNVARAMAGLPLVTARVSIERCTELGINPPNGIAFEMFRLIERVLKEPVLDLGRAIDCLRTHLVNGPERHLSHAAELRKNWYFLETAIRSAARKTSAPHGSFAFRVFAEYSKVSASHSAVEALLANAHRLDMEHRGN